jgi:hypothetical protein
VYLTSRNAINIEADCFTMLPLRSNAKRPSQTNVWRVVILRLSRKSRLFFQHAFQAFPSPRPPLGLFWLGILSENLQSCDQWMLSWTSWRTTSFAALSVEHLKLRFISFNLPLHESRPNKLGIEGRIRVNIHSCLSPGADASHLLLMTDRLG